MLKDGRYVNIIRNGNYIGEFKKNVFSAEDWAAKTMRGGAVGLKTGKILRLD